MERGSGFTNPVGTGDVLDVCLCLGSGGVGRGLDQGLEGWGGVMTVSRDSLCRWQVQVSVYGARRIPAHLRFTSAYSVCGHILDICL